MDDRGLVGARQTDESSADGESMLWLMAFVLAIGIGIRLTAARSRADGA